MPSSSSIRRDGMSRRTFTSQTTSHSCRWPGKSCLSACANGRIGASASRRRSRRSSKNLAKTCKSASHRPLHLAPESTHRRNRTVFGYCSRSGGTPNPSSKTVQNCSNLKLNCLHLISSGSRSVFTYVRVGKMRTFKSRCAAPRAERDSTMNCGLRCRRRCSE